MAQAFHEALVGHLLAERQLGGALCQRTNSPHLERLGDAVGRAPNLEPPVAVAVPVFALLPIVVVAIPGQQSQTGKRYRAHHGAELARVSHGGPAQLIEAHQSGIQERHRLRQKAHQRKAAAHAEIHQVAGHEAGIGVAVTFLDELVIQRSAVHVLRAVPELGVHLVQVLDLAHQLLHAILVQHHAAQLCHLRAQTVGIFLRAELDDATTGQHRGVHLAVAGRQLPARGHVGSRVVAQV